MKNVINFSPNASEKELRLAIVACGEICYARRLLSSSDGNISVRLDSERVLITPSGACKGRLNSEDLRILNLDGTVINSERVVEPSSETPMHLEVYRQRSDIFAVIHAHPIFATALTVSGLEYPFDILPEVMQTLQDVPVTKYAMPSSHEDADVIRLLIRKHNAILLRQHGSLTAGKNLDEALIHLERVEYVAEVFWRASMLGKVNRIAPDELEKLRQKL
jgi:L-fuculose-phosphate aldolase